MRGATKNGQVILPVILCRPRLLLNGAIQVVLKFLFISFFLLKEEENCGNSGSNSGYGRNNRNEYGQFIAFFQNEHLRLFDFV